MANKYLLNFKGKYRILAVIDSSTNDFPRDSSGEIEDDIELYIPCQGGAKIGVYGLNKSRRTLLYAYIPSLKRGHNIVKQIDKLDIPYYDYDETDSEIAFKFDPANIDQIAELLNAKTAGASISPLSVKNLPKSKVTIDKGKMDVYQSISSKVEKGDYLIIHRITTSFLNDVLSKKLKKGRQKTYDYATEMRNLKMSRQVKEYIYTKGLFDEYCEYLKEHIDEFYNAKK